MNKHNNIFEKLRKIALCLVPIIGAAGTIIPLILGKSNLFLLGIYLAVPMILATVITLKKSETEANFKVCNNKLFSLFLSLYFIFISISIYLLHLFDIRPFIYYFIISVAFVLVLLEILLFDISNNKKIIILTQIAILFVNLIWGVTLKYYFFIGRTDVFFHSFLIQSLIQDGHVTDIFDNYKPFPLWHILCTFIYKVSAIQLSIPKTMFFTNGIIYSFLPIVTYLISTKILKDRKLSLLFSLFVVINTSVIFYGMYSISRSVVAFLFIVLILVLIEANNPEKAFLSTILTFSLIVYHPSSMPFIILILFCVSLLERFCNKETKSFLSSNFMILLICMTFFYWLYFSQILHTFKNNIFIPAPESIMTKSIIFTPLNELFNYLQYSFLLFFIIIGFYAAMYSKKISTFGKELCIVGLILVPVSFPGPSLLLNKLAFNLQIERFDIYTFLFFGMTSSIGFREVYLKSKKYGKICVIFLFMLMVFLSISNDFDASDNPLIKRPFYTFYFTYEEQTSIQHVASVTQGTIMSDYLTYNDLYNSKYRNVTNILELDNKKTEFLKNQTNNIFLIRNSELSKRPLKLYSTKGKTFTTNFENISLDYYSQDEQIWTNLNHYNKIYNSKSVIGYY